MASIYQSIEILSKEKGIDSQIVLDAVKDAMLVAARKQFKTNEDLAADFDEKGNLILFALKTVVESVTDKEKEITQAEARKLSSEAEIGAQVRIMKSTDALGRISAQTAKQVILQKVREAERENIFSEFSHRVGELVNCVVKRVEGQDLVVDLGKTEARLSKKEQSRLENFSVGDRARCVIKAVDKTGKNAGVVVSRAAAELVMRLFEQEVPEIYDGTVVIRGCAREAGERTKIAVLSRDRDVDCVGACVGMKGMRVQSIIRELRGEKIDIIEFSEDPVVFATHALSPAKITRVAIIDSNEKHMEVIVEDSQLSLAIGKKGQNVRLAAKLLGWRIDIKTEEEKRQEVEATMASLSSGAPLSVLLDHGMPETVLERLIAAGIGTVERVGSMTPEELEQNAGIDSEGVQSLSTAINAFYAQMESPAPVAEAAPVTEEAPAPIAADESATAAPADGADAAAVPSEETASVEASAENAGSVPEDTEVPEVSEAPEAPPESSDTMGTSGLPVDPSGQ